MSDLERFKVGFIKGESGEGYPHVVGPKGQVVGFGRRADGGNQLFSSPEKAAEAARQLNSGAAPEDIEAR